MKYLLPFYTLFIFSNSSTQAQIVCCPPFTQGKYEHWEKGSEFSNAFLGILQNYKKLPIHIEECDAALLNRLRKIGSIPDDDIRDESSKYVIIGNFESTLQGVKFSCKITYISTAPPSNPCIFPTIYLQEKDLETTEIFEKKIKDAVDKIDCSFFKIPLDTCWEKIKNYSVEEMEKYLKCCDYSKKCLHIKEANDFIEKAKEEFIRKVDSISNSSISDRKKIKQLSNITLNSSIFSQEFLDSSRSKISKLIEDQKKNETRRWIGHSALFLGGSALVGLVGIPSYHDYDNAKDIYKNFTDPRSAIYGGVPREETRAMGNKALRRSQFAFLAGGVACTSAVLNRILWRTAIRKGKRATGDVKKYSFYLQKSQNNLLLGLTYQF